MILNLTQSARRTPLLRLSRARGGAMLGLIVGLLIGLAVALAVAIYVAKVPIPFISAPPVHNGSQDAAESQKNNNWNPNAALQTHGPVVSASAASVASSATAPADANATGNATTTQPPAQNPSADTQTATAGNNTVTPAPGRAVQTTPGRKPPSSNDPLGDFAMAHTRDTDNTAHNANTNATAEPFVYFVQTGAFNAAQDADAQRARLSLQGMEASISPIDQGGDHMVYRVRIGPFQNKAAADQIKSRLASDNIDATLVLVQR